ncbi:unknown [Firmicutes bacterium CAG:646]|nr:unknown [Firmicutes bacterium CAG:646]
MNDEGKNQTENRSADHEYKSKPPVQDKGKSDSHDQHDRASNQRADTGAYGGLHNGYIGGQSRHQRRGRKVIQVGKGVILDLFILCQTEICSKAVGCPGSKTGEKETGDQCNESAEDHQPSLLV